MDPSANHEQRAVQEFRIANIPTHGKNSPRSERLPKNEQKKNSIFISFCKKQPCVHSALGKESRFLQTALGYKTKSPSAGACNIG